ncbi:antifreeze protein type I [Paenibacillus sp. 32O-W]|uniref:SPFH domain-containing protein n=1 Tax=Paenibacillus sp. 32O-W TaxID=1695218 RepID=UPI000720B589|nr:SPFH domain-containing protein [Paenibacillus sp. 32O-W]ALS25663.1 antifreeze protein type I [Paenibacillus sp. 32O-W]
MAIIRVVKYDGPADVFAWKYPEHELGTWTQLIVNESQEAILFKGGQALDRFGAGRHTLSTQNIPILQSVINLPFGGDSPFTAEVWYVNRLNVLDVKWGTATPLMLQDPKFHIIVPVRSFGQFGIQIEDSRKFLLKLVGTLPAFDRDAMVRYFRGLLMMNINELISSYAVHKKVSFLEMGAYIGEMSAHMTNRVKETFAEYGIKLLHFYVESVNVPDNDPATIRLKEALAKKAEMDILGYTYQQERTFDTLEGAAKNEGTSGDLLGTGLGMGLGLGIGDGFGRQISRLTPHMETEALHACPNCGTMNRHDAKFCSGCGRQTSAPSPQAAASEAGPKGTPCSNCGHLLQPNAKFCPNCGDKFDPCPNCGADNPGSAEQCAKCGHTLKAPACAKCGESLTPGAKFCPSCGASAVLKCGRCQHEVKPNQKFCPECGNNLTEQEEKDG